MRQPVMTLVMLASMACGAGGADADGTPLLPLAVGNQWVYDEVTAANGELLGTVTKTVTDRESYDGQSTLVLTTEQTNSPITKVSNWLVAGAQITRLIQRRHDADTFELVNYRTYDPGFLRITGDLTGAGEQHQESHVRTEYLADGTQNAQKNKTYTWLVEQVDEQVTVPAGTFSCVRVRRVDDDNGVKTYWYAAGVGKVKEADSEEEEHLRDYVVSE